MLKQTSVSDTCENNSEKHKEVSDYSIGGLKAFKIIFTVAG